MKKLTLIAAATLIVAAPAVAGDIEAGKKIATEVCAACHGADGNSPTAQFPILAGQHADYLAKSLADYKSGQRDNAIMKGFAANLSKKDINDLAAYFASQKGLTVRY